MTSPELLASLTKRGVVITVDGADLLVVAQKGVITPSDLEELAVHKQAVISLLTPTGSPAVAQEVHRDVTAQGYKCQTTSPAARLSAFLHPTADDLADLASRAGYPRLRLTPVMLTIGPGAEDWLHCAYHAVQADRIVARRRLLLYLNRHDRQDRRS